jgi:hypothetical protein
VILLIATIVGIVSYRLSKRSFFDPAIITPFLFLLYWAAPQIGNRTLPLESSREMFYLLFAVVFLTAFYAGSFMSPNLRMPSVSLQGSNRSVVISAWVFLAISAPFLLYQMSATVPLILRGAPYHAYREAYGRTLLVGDPYIWVSAAFVLILSVKKSRVSVVSLAALTLYAVSIGERGGVAMVLMAAYAAHSLREKIEPKRIKTAILLVLGLSAAIMYGNVRAGLAGGLAEIAFRTIRSIAQLGLAAVSPFDTGEFFNIGAASKLAIVDPQQDWNWGASFLQAVMKVPPVNSRLVNFHTRPMVQVADEYGSQLMARELTFGVGGIMPGVEGYLAFGLLGTAIFAFLWGFITRTLYKMVIRRPSGLFPAWYSLAFPILTLHASRSDFQSTLNVLLRQFTLPVYFAILLGFFFHVLRDKERIPIKHRMSRLHSESPYSHHTDST